MTQQWLFIFGLALSSFIDLLNTAFMYFFLHRSRTDYSQWVVASILSITSHAFLSSMKHTIDKVLMYTTENGVLTMWARILLSIHPSLIHILGNSSQHDFYCGFNMREWCARDSTALRWTDWRSCSLCWCRTTLSSSPCTSSSANVCHAQVDSLHQIDSQHSPISQYTPTRC